MITSLFQTAAEPKTHDNASAIIAFFFLMVSNLDHYDNSNISYFLRLKADIFNIITKLLLVSNQFFIFLILITLDQII